MFTMGLVVWIPSALAAACSSSSTPPAELGSQDTGIAERPPTPEPTPEPPPPEPEPMEAACQPLGEGGAVVSSNSVTFGDGGLVGCGQQATPVIVTVSNNSCDDINFTTSLSSGGSYYTVSPPSGTIPSHLTQNVTINPNPIPQISPVTADLYEGTVSITTTAQGDSAHIIQLHMTAYGVILTSTEFGQTLDFGGVSIGNKGSTQYSVTNTGNAPASVTFAVGSTNFGIGSADGGPAVFSIPANQSVAPVVTFSPTVVQPYTDTVNATVAPGVPLCAAPPATTLLKGQGSTGVNVQPTDVTFGLVQCGTQPPPFQTITITNTGAAIQYTPTFALGPTNSPYTLADSTGTPIASAVPYNLGAASNTTIQVVPKKINNPANTSVDGYLDTLTIATTGPGDSPHNIKLHETAQGTIFVLTPATVCLNNCATGTTLFQPFTVSNNGSLAAGYTLDSVTTQGPAGTFTLPGLEGGTLSPNTAQSGEMYVKTLDCTLPDAAGVTCTVAANCSNQDLGTLTLTPSTGTILCADVPPPMPLSLNGPCH